MTSVNSGIDFNKYEIKLERGPHASPTVGLCLMECVAYIMGEKHSDTPDCSDPICGFYGILINDHTVSSQRKQLIKYVFRLAGSKNPELERQRMYMVLDAAVHKFLPKTLANLNLKAYLSSVSEVPTVVDEATATAASNVLLAISSHIDTKKLKSEQIINFKLLKTMLEYVASALVRSSEIETTPALKRHITKAAFSALTPAIHYMCNESFQMHCDLFESLLALTDEKEVEGAPIKLKELDDISNKREVSVA
jgi:hypothetical protein